MFSRALLTVLFWLFLVLAAVFAVLVILSLAGAPVAAPDAAQGRIAGLLQDGVSTVARIRLVHTRPWLTLGLVFTLVVLVGLVVGISQNRTLRTLHSAFQDVSGGDLSRKITLGRAGPSADVYADFNKMVRLVRKKITMEKYVSDSTNKMIDELRTGQFSSEASRSNIAIFFSDIRGFTSYAERNDPMVVVDTLNTLFDIQVEAVVANNGDIDKFIGDEVMAIFDNPQDAYRASVEIQKRIAEFNEHRTRPLQAGIGIHYGEAVIGAVGSGNFFNWTAIGNTVNVGQRLCSSALGGQTLVSSSCFRKIRTSRKHETQELRIKGIKKRVPVVVFST
jgi:adenylate cyclase